MTIPLSILDLIPLASGVSSSQALRNSLELACLADQLGYRRYWFAEHHNVSTVVSTTPEIMIALSLNSYFAVHAFMYASEPRYANVGIVAAIFLVASFVLTGIGGLKGLLDRSKGSSRA